jgi:hypothetical protein
MEGKRYINLLETSIKTEKAIVKEKNELVHRIEGTGQSGCPLRYVALLL